MGPLQVALYREGFGKLIERPDQALFGLGLQFLGGADLLQDLAGNLSASDLPLELILTVGYYMMIARLLESTAVDLDPPAGTSVIDAIR